ncbi:NB-ARC domain-containing protein [Pendulispora rubella]|uniref:NB-ARC domain-containing protein n=2 Tax=Pendulispora rubella TaxID=2741070 RepID=A0ABZ2KZI4_9BACT
MTRTTPHASREVPREPMFGRDAVCDDVVACFERGLRLVTLVGPGGIGKSRLAEEAAFRLRETWPTRTVGLSASRDVSRSIARALGIKLGRTAQSEEDDSLTRLVDALRSHDPILIVLDDADAVLEQAASFARACREALPEIRLLVTTREPLGIAQEHVRALEPLPLEAAVAMFEARAAQTEGEDIRPLVERLDGIPLAIELAASRVRVMSPKELLVRLEERFRILKSDRRDLRERHLTLAGTLEWSWELSGPDERQAFACLGAFTGPLTLEAFEAVVGPELEGDPIDVASALLRKSLATRLGVRGPARLSMLETLRAFARSKLASLPAREEIERRHAMFYLGRAEHMAARTYGAGGAQALDELEADLPHLLAIFDREVTRTPEIAARIGVSLADLAFFRNAIDLHNPCITLTHRAADASGDAALRVRARVLGARIALELGQPDKAEKTLGEALGLAQGSPLEAEVLRSLGWARLALGRIDEAEEALGRAFEQHHAAGDARGEADALAAQGIARALRGEIDRAHVFLAAAHALHVTSGETIRRLKVVEMASLMGLNLETESAPPSMDDLRASAAAHHAAGRAWRAALDLLRVAELASAAGHDDDARTALETARRYAEEAHVPAALCDTVAHAARFSAPSPTNAADVPKREAADPTPQWQVGPEARWVVLPDGTRTDLTRHGPVRRILDALTTLHATDKGHAISAVDLLEAGWPGERVRYEAGMLRVYTGIRRLRKLGLEPILVTRDDGYLLDPAAHVVRGDAL